MFFHIALKDLKILALDYKALLSLVLMPAVIMLILGTALGNVFTNDSTISKFPVVIANNDKGTESTTFIKVIKDYYSNIFDVTVEMKSSAMDKLKSKKVPAVVVIPEDYSSKIKNQEKVTVEVISNSEDSIKGQMVSGTVNGYMNIVSVSLKGYEAFFETAAKSGNKNFMSLGTNGSVMMDIASKLGNQLIKFKESTQSKTKPISALQYYAVSMLVMYLLFSSVTGVNMMLQEKDNQTLGRIIGAGVSKFQLIFGKCIGLATIGCLQSLVLVVFTSIVYKVSWGDSIYAIVLLSLCVILVSSGFGMFIAAVGKTLKAANSLGQILIMVFTALGGGMMPFYLFPSILKAMANITPNRHAMDAYYKLMQGAAFTEILPNCIILLAMGVAFMTIGISKFRTV